MNEPTARPVPRSQLPEGATCVMSVGPLTPEDYEAIEDFKEFLRLKKQAEPRIDRALKAVRYERFSQLQKWGEQHREDGTGGPVMRSEAERMKAACQYLADNGGADWRAVLLEEVYETMAEDDPKKLRAELVQVAAVATAWIEDIDTRKEDAGV